MWFSYLRGKLIIANCHEIVSYLSTIAFASVHDCIEALSLRLRSSIACFCSADILLIDSSSLCLTSNVWCNPFSWSRYDFVTDSLSSFISYRMKWIIIEHRSSHKPFSSRVAKKKYNEKAQNLLLFPLGSRLQRYCFHVLLSEKGMMDYSIRNHLIYNLCFKWIHNIFGGRNPFSFLSKLGKGLQGLNWWKKSIWAQHLHSVTHSNTTHPSTHIRERERETESKFNSITYIFMTLNWCTILIVQCINCKDLIFQLLSQFLQNWTLHIYKLWNKDILADFITKLFT